MDLFDAVKICIFQMINLIYSKFEQVHGFAIGDFEFHFGSSFTLRMKYFS